MCVCVKDQLGSGLGGGKHGAYNKHFKKALTFRVEQVHKPERESVPPETQVFVFSHHVAGPEIANILDCKTYALCHNYSALPLPESHYR